MNTAQVKQSPSQTPADHSASPLRLSYLYVDNFKSLVEFWLPLAEFSCLIGLNGSGKSSVLQAVDFMSRLFKGQVSHWLEQRQWKPADLNSKLTGKSNITFRIDLALGSEVFVWQGSFNRTSLRCTQEWVWINNHLVFTVHEGHYLFLDERGGWIRTKITFDYEGSIFSLLRDETFSETLLSIKRFLQRTASLDLLAPQFLRKKTDWSGGELGLGGERLSAFLHELSSEQRIALESRLKACYPQLSRFFTRSLRAGWKELNIQEEFGKTRLVTEAKHVNDGMLRMMAIVAELVTGHEFLLFDEIENGINPELVEFLLDALVNARQQILVTTHSPMILNYLDDEVARAGVQYLYRTPEGYTRSIPFFEIPSVSEKLEAMGPGEAFVDTVLPGLYEEIRAMESRNQEADHVDPR